MEQLTVVKAEARKAFSSDAQFIKSNTELVTFEHLLNDCIIPVFSKDNETTISHIDFIDTANEVVNHIFKNEMVNLPAVRVSHPIKGRIPEAIRKPVNELQEFEKTIYYERLAFRIDIPSIR